MSENPHIELPPLGEDSIARIERAVFEEVADAPRTATAVRRSGRRNGRRNVRRRRGWTTGLGVAAAFVCGILIAPALLDALSTTDASSSSVARDASYEADAGGALPGSADIAPADLAEAGAAADGQSDAARDIITTAQVTLSVTDVSSAVVAIGDVAVGHDGYVEATDVGLSSQSASDIHSPEPRAPGSGWIRIRVPATDLDEVIRALGENGEVLRSSISRQDVTSAAVDLRARVDALRASVKRLSELMSRSGSVADLIAAETALSERQAQLESHEQELKNLDEQVAMSTISVELAERGTTAKADPAGFADGLLAGWNGLIVSVNAVVVALGFLLPWLVIAAVAGLVFWLIRRGMRRRSEPEV